MIYPLCRSKLNKVEVDADKPEFLKPSWNHSLKLMSDTNFLKNLVEFDKDQINDEICEHLDPVFASEDYNLENAKNVCGDVAGLLSWTKSMHTFYFINKEVLPLKVCMNLKPMVFICTLMNAKVYVKCHWYIKIYFFTI